MKVVLFSPKESGLALVIFACGFLMGCDGQFDKCMNTRLAQEETDFKLDRYLYGPYKEAGAFTLRAVISVKADAIQEMESANCNANNLYNAGKKCFFLVSEVKRYEVMEKEETKLATRKFYAEAKRKAQSICNDQGIYE